MVKALKRILIVLFSTVLFAVLFVLVMALVAPKPKQQLVLPDELVLFAHRGQVFCAPENTIEAIAAAENEGFKAVEIDIQITKDGELVLFHDHYAKTLLGVDSLRIEDMLFDDVQKLNLIWKRKRTDYKVPKLKDVFEQHPNLYYYLDIKEPSWKKVEAVTALVHDCGMSDKVIISHANFFVQIKHKFKYPDVANCLEGFNSGSEKYLKFFPRKLQPTYFSSFVYNVTPSHIDYLKKHDLLSRRIVYGVEKKNVQEAIQDFELKYLIIDIEDREEVFLYE